MAAPARGTVPLTAHATPRSPDLEAQSHERLSPRTEQPWVLARQAAPRLLRCAAPLRVTACAPSSMRRPCQGRLAASAASSLLAAGDGLHTPELVEPPRPQAIPWSCLGFPLRITRRTMVSL